jgi:hypothetical protein
VNGKWAQVLERVWWWGECYNLTLICYAARGAFGSLLGLGRSGVGGEGWNLEKETYAKVVFMANQQRREFMVGWVIGQYQRVLNFYRGSGCLAVE